MLKTDVLLKGIVPFEMIFWYVLAYLKGIQDVGVFVSAEVPMLIFLGQTVLVCQSCNGGLWSPPQRACTEKSKLNMSFKQYLYRGKNSLCMLFEVVTIDLHNMADRHERFDLKI